VDYGLDDFLGRKVGVQFVFGEAVALLGVEAFGSG
jgi:hypothetical protein